MVSFDPERREPLTLSVVTGGARVLGELWPSAPADAAQGLPRHSGHRPAARNARHLVRATPLAGGLLYRHAWSALAIGLALTGSDVETPSP